MAQRNTSGMAGVLTLNGNKIAAGTTAHYLTAGMTGAGKNRFSVKAIEDALTRDMAAFDVSWPPFGKDAA